MSPTDADLTITLTPRQTIKELVIANGPSACCTALAQACAEQALDGWTAAGPRPSLDDIAARQAWLQAAREFNALAEKINGLRATP